ncbi:MAG TPA: hypothetical protein VIK72_07980 [Clostridiaceae bacterium]
MKENHNIPDSELEGTTSFLMSKSKLKRRIIMVIKYKKLSKRSIGLGIIVFLALGAIFLSNSLSKPVKAAIKNAVVTTPIVTPAITQAETPPFNYEDSLKAIQFTLPPNWHLDTTQKVQYTFIDDKGNNVGYVAAMDPSDDLKYSMPNHSSLISEETLPLPIGTCDLMTLDSDNGSAASGLTGTHDAYMAGITTKENTKFLLFFSKNDKNLKSKPQFIEILRGLTLDSATRN